MRHSPPPERGFSFDLHVLGLPPAFVLSQDQTLKFDLELTSSRHNVHMNSKTIHTLNLNLMHQTRAQYIFSRYPLQRKAVIQQPRRPGIPSHQKQQCQLTNRPTTRTIKNQPDKPDQPVKSNKPSDPPRRRDAGYRPTIHPSQHNKFNFFNRPC